MESRELFGNEAAQAAREENPERSLEREAVEIYLEHLLAQYTKVDEGQDGVIGTVDTSGFDPEVLAVLMKDRVQEGQPDQFALKLLKIYSNRGAAREEFDAQQKAFELLHQAAAEDPSIPQVPEIYFADELEVHEDDTLGHLRTQGVTVGEDRKVEVLLMDYVPGENFATYLYTEVARRHPALAELSRQLKEGVSIPFNHIVEKVTDALGIKPKEEDRLAAFYRGMADYLYEQGFEIPISFLQFLKKATDIMHKNNVYHNDLHERNVVVQKDSEGRITSSFIIDFGKSTLRGEQGLAERVEKRFMNDEYIYSSYRKLARTGRERADQGAKELFGDAISVLEARMREEYSGFKELVAENIGKPNGVLSKVDEFIKEKLGLNPYTSAEQYWPIKAYMLYEIAHEHSDASEAILGYFEDTLKNDKTVASSLPVRNMLKRVIAEMRK